MSGVRRLALGLALAAAAAGLLYWATLASVGATCEACIAYAGHARCASAAAATREEAERTALATACAGLTSGVTDTIRCQSAPPTSLTCR